MAYTQEEIDAKIEEWLITMPAPGRDFYTYTGLHNPDMLFGSAEALVDLLNETSEYLRSINYGNTAPEVNDFPPSDLLGG